MEHEVLLGQLLRQLREAHSLTQGALGAKLSVSGSLVCLRERGDSRLDGGALAATLDVLEASPATRMLAWRYHFASNGHPPEDAEAMALVKAGLKAAGAA